MNDQLIDKIYDIIIVNDVHDKLIPILLLNRFEFSKTKEMNDGNVEIRQASCRMFLFTSTNSYNQCQNNALQMKKNKR